jgi:CRISPR-associated protein Cmr4
MSTQLLFVHARSPLHAGTGQGVGAIDLPIAREKATNIPYIPGSSIKGPLRDRSETVDADRTRVVFGPKTDSASDHAGAAVFSDARLLLLPVRSLAGTFAWVTSPYLLRRFKQDAADAGVAAVKALEVPQPKSVNDQLEGLVSSAGSADVAQPNNHHGGVLKLPNKNLIVLEDLDLLWTPNDDVRKWAKEIGQLVFDPTWQNLLLERLCVVHDDVMTFLLETATEVVARIKINDDTKTVQKGGLWYEESLPTETVLVGLVSSSNGRAQGTEPMDANAVSCFIHKRAHGQSIQLGGKATVGRGLCQLSLVPATPAPPAPPPEGSGAA